MRRARMRLGALVCLLVATVTMAAMFGGCSGNGGGPSGANSPVSIPGGTPGGPSAPPPIFTEFFDGSIANGWTLPQTAWEIGDPNGSGPGTALSGTNLLALKLAGGYDNNWDFSCVTPEIDLTNAVNPILSFSHWYEMELFFDGVMVRVIVTGFPTPFMIDPMQGYMQIVISADDHGFTGTSGGWIDERFDLSAFVGFKIRLEFRFTSDIDLVGTGYYLDNLQVFESNGLNNLFFPFRSTLLKEDFEGGPGIATGTSIIFRTEKPNTAWAIGPPRQPAPQYYQAAPAGPNAAGVGHLIGSYSINITPDRFRTVQPIDFTSAVEAGVYFQHMFGTEANNQVGGVDGCHFIISADGINWIELQPRPEYVFGVAAMASDGWSYLTLGNEGVGWRRVFVDLTPAFAIVGKRFHIGWEFASDANPQTGALSIGYALDDIRVMTR